MGGRAIRAQAWRRAVPPTVGSGESAAEAAARTPADATWLIVLTDGLITGVVPRAALVP